MPSDFEPICPKCGDLNSPGWRVCETCGSYLLADDAERDHLIRFEYFRRERRYPQVGITPVEENLLDTKADGDVTSRGDTASGVGGAGLVQPLAADPVDPSRLVDRGSA